MWRTLWLLVFAGCAQHARPVIRAEPFDFGGVRATVRDFSGHDICEAEPRFLLDEISSVNGLLKRFLAAAPSSAESTWPDSTITLVEEAVDRLPALIEVHRRNLDALAPCAFARQGAWPPLVDRARALLDRSSAALTAAPELLHAVRTARALAQWHSDRLQQQQSARRGCPVRLGNAVIYFAWSDGETTRWLFCDGAEVTQVGNAQPQLEGTAVEFTRGRRPTQAAYFTAVTRYPASAIERPPSDGGAVSVW